MAKRSLKPAIRILLPILIFLLSGAVVFGAVVLFSSHVRGNGDMSAATLGTEAEVEFSAQTAAQDLIFTESGEKIDFVLSTKNSTTSDLSFIYHLTHNASSDLASAILVHYDGKFIGTLGELCSIGDGNVGSAELGRGFVSAGATNSAHTLTLELHEATPESYYDGKSLTITLESYTQTIDYDKYTFVSNASELVRAIDDINSGMLDNPTVVLGAPIALDADYELLFPCSIDLNGNLLSLSGKSLTLSGIGVYTLFSSAPMASGALEASGSIVLDGASTLLDIDSFYSSETNVGALYGERVSLAAYDTEAATALLIEEIKSGFSSISAGSSVSIFGANGFYADVLTLSTETGSISGGILTVPASETTEVTTVTVGDTAYDVKIIGSDDAAFEGIKSEYLSHLPSDSAEKITSNLFLPTAIPEKNATIIWRSGNEGTISSDGIISAVVRDNEPATLYAEIIVNDKVATVEYSFHVSSQNNETKFSYLVAQLSPIMLDNVYSVNEETGLDNSALAYHYLPSVNADGDYDYRTNFSTPSARANPYVWIAYRDIGLESIEFSVSTIYNYVSCGLDSNGDAYAYLNTSVFYDYAQINIKGTFKNGEEYDGVVNVTISLGDDSDLQNKVFRYVESLLNEVDILENIIATRREEGMLYERGDFYLPTKYMTYVINYGIPDSSKDIIYEILAPGATSAKDGRVNDSDQYLIRVNPEHFYSSDTAVGLNVNIRLESSDASSETRILYFNTPAVIKPDEGGFQNLSVFNSVKYQIYQQLTDPDERDGESGFTLNGSVLTNNTGAYILRRDAEQATKITFQVKGDSSATDNTEVYTFLRLIEWATCDTSGILASTVWSGGGETASEGQEFLTDPEIAVIKNYWKSVTGSDISSDLWDTAFREAIGRVITNGDVLNERIQAIGLNAATYYKYVEMLNWAIDKQDYGTPAGGKYAGSPPNLGTLLRQYTFDGNGGYTHTGTASSYTSSSNKYYQDSKYQEDQSEYISEVEAELMRALVLNLAVNAGKESAGAAFVRAFDENVVIPTYINSGGIGLLVRELYSALGKEGSGFSAEVASLNGYVIPTVTGLDDSLSALRYLTALTELYIYGEEPSGTHTGLAAFLTTSGLSGFFNQITASNKNFTKLEMILVARNYVNFDITFTERLTSLTHLNYSHNSGITTIGPLVNLPMGNLEYLNVAGVDVTFEFSEYVLSNIYAAGGNSAEIWYTEDIGGAVLKYGGGTSVDESLTYLNEANKLQSHYLQLIPSLATGSGAKDIYWRIESGNMIHFITVAGELAELEAIENYYYCTATFGSFVAGHIYAFRRNGASYFTDLGAYTAVNGIPDSVEFTDAEKNNTTSGNHDTETPGTPNTTYNQSSTQNVTGNNRVNNSSNQNITLTITYGNGQTATVNNVRSLVYNQKIQKTVTTQITVVRISGRQATKTVTYYDDSTDQVVEATYVYMSGDRYTQTYQLTINYWYCDFYYTARNGWNTTTTYLRNTNYAEWTTLNYNGTTYQRTNYADTESSRTSGFSENNFRLAAQGIEDVALSSTQALISPVGTINGQAKVDALTELMENAISGGILYLYNGNTTEVEYYNNSTTRYKTFTFTHNYLYSPSVDNQGFITWTRNTSVNGENVGAGGMDAILAEANLHLNDHLYGMYYGMYYGYYGSTFTTLAGNSYVSGYVYRLLIGDDGKFYFEHADLSKMGLVKNTFTVIDHVNNTDGLLDMARLATADNVGDLYYYLPSGNDNYHHLPNRFYIITRSETGDYYAKLFGAIDSVFEDNGDGTYTLRLENTRIYDTGGDLYGGTGGTEYVVVTALIKTDDGESIRKFKIKVIG